MIICYINSFFYTPLPKLTFNLYYTMGGMGLFSAQRGVVLANSSYEHSLQAYRRQFPKFMDSLAEPDVLPYISLHQIIMSGKRFEDLTDDDLSAMYIPGRYKYII
jgi:hypothetical protein